MEEPTGVDGGQAFAISCFSFLFLLQGPTLIGFSFLKKTHWSLHKIEAYKCFPLQPM
jgi:hypothetical protein